MNAEALYREAQALEKQCIAHRRELHRRAETGFDLEKTREYVEENLKKLGIEPQRCGRCGVAAQIGRGGKTFLLRADMDALPVREETGLDFACADGNMHACGHDMHAAMLLTAAQLLKKHEAELAGQVRLMFQPAEELLLGAKDMIENGILEDVNAALMLHVMTAQEIPAGTMIISAPGVSAPAAGTFSVRIQGTGSHGAMPHTGADPITAAAHIVTALQEINARELAPGDNAALTIGCLQAGSTANVIPDTALIRGNFRAFEDAAFELIHRRIGEICTGIARVFRTEAEVEYHGSCPTLVNDAALGSFAESKLVKLLGAEKVFNAAKLASSSAAKSSGSEDFAAVSHRVPSLMLALAAGEIGDGYVHPLHHPKADFDERALFIGAAAHAFLAMEWLNEHH